MLPTPAQLKPKDFKMLHIRAEDLGTEPLDEFFYKAYRFITAADFENTGIHGRPGRVPHAACRVPHTACLPHTTHNTQT